MAFDPVNLTPNLPYWATPEQIAAQRDYARALQQQSATPVKHWTMGVSNMLNALLGGMNERQAMETERAQRANLAREATGQGAAPLAPQPSAIQPQPSPQPGGTLAAAAPGGDMADYAARVSKLESGGNYGALGPETKGDRAYGKYQVMGANIPGWTKAALGTSMTPEQFLASPEAQEVVFKHKFGEYVNRYGNPQDAASAWFTGRPAAQGANARDILGTTGAGYVQKFNALAPAQGGPPAAPAPGGGTVAGPNATMAGVIARPAAPQGAPDQQAEYNRLINVGILNGMKPAEATTWAAGVVNERAKFHPQFATDPYGWETTTRPGAPPQFTGRKSPTHVGYKEGPVPGTMEVTNAPGGTPRIVMRPLDLGGVAPGGPAPASPTPAAGPGPVTASAKPSTVPPPVPPKPPTEPAPDESGPDFIERMAKSQTKQAINPAASLQEKVLEGFLPESQKARIKKEQETQGEQYSKAYAQKFEKLAKNAEISQVELPQLQLLQKIIQNDKFYSGFMAKDVAILDQIAKQFGLSKGETASLANLGEKLGQAGSLENIQELTGPGGVGAIRIPEMQMIQKSNFALENTKEANRAVVELRTRQAQRNLEVAEMARRYAKASGTHTIDPDFEQHVQNYYGKHPTVTPEEMQQYTNAITTGLGSNPMTAALAGAIGTPAPGGKTYPQPLPGGVEKLLSQTGANAAEADRQFDEHFGPGAAKRARESAPPKVPVSR